jgi:AbrB family looped-hinge helix DNA binding protein
MTETTLTDRGQTAVPAWIRKRFRIKPGQKLTWVEDGKIIYVLPVARDPIRAFRGSSKNSGLIKALLRDRQEDARSR